MEVTSTSASFRSTEDTSSGRPGSLAEGRYHIKQGDSKMVPNHERWHQASWVEARTLAKRGSECPSVPMFTFCLWLLGESQPQTSDLPMGQDRQEDVGTHISRGTSRQKREPEAGGPQTSLCARGPPAKRDTWPRLPSLGQLLAPPSPHLTSTEGRGYRCYLPLLLPRGDAPGVVMQTPESPLRMPQVKRYKSKENTVGFLLGQPGAESLIEH